MRVVLALCVCALVGGCVTTDLPAETIQPICKALIGPIKYNSTKKTSLRFAGQVLALDLKQRNQVGERLGCTGY